jgi:hypothetical protein
MDIPIHQFFGENDDRNTEVAKLLLVFLFLFFPLFSFRTI